jgi:putative membrane protein
MDEIIESPIQGAEKEEKKKKKAMKEDLMVEKLLLAYERTLIAWTKAATHILIFGFAIYKLLESKLHDSGSHPILDILSPKRIALILFVSGFFALLMATIRFVQVQKRFNEFSWRTYFLPILILSYVILTLLFLLSIGMLLGRDIS